MVLSQTLTNVRLFSSSVWSPLAILESPTPSWTIIVPCNSDLGGLLKTSFCSTSLRNTKIA